MYVHFLNFLHSIYKIWIVLLAANLLNCHHLRLRGFGAAIETHVLSFLKWEVLFILGSLSYMLDFHVKGIIRPFAKFLELFSGNRQNWQMTLSDVFVSKLPGLQVPGPQSRSLCHPVLAPKGLEY